MAGRQKHDISAFLRYIEDWGFNTHRIKTRKDLAKELGVSYPTTSGWFAHSYRPSLDAIGQIARQIAGEGHEEQARALAEELARLADWPPAEAARAFVFVESPYQRMKRKLQVYAVDHHISDDEAKELIDLLEQDRTEYEAQRSGASQHDTPLLAY